MAINPFLQYAEDEKKRLKPSQVAGQEVKKKQATEANPFLAYREQNVKPVAKAVAEAPIIKKQEPVIKPAEPVQIKPQTFMEKVKSGISGLAEAVGIKKKTEVPPTQIDVTTLPKLEAPIQSGPSIYDLASGKSQTSAMLTPEAQTKGQQTLEQTNEFLKARAKQAKEYVGQKIEEKAQRDIPFQMKVETAKSLTAGFGDVISGAGKIAKWKGADGLGDQLIRKGGELQKFMPDTTEFDTGLEWKDAYNPRLYTTLVARGSAFTIAMLPLAFLGGEAGVTGAGLLGLGKLGTTILGAIGSSALSTPIEAATEAGNTYDEMIAAGKSREEANAAANKTYKGNALLLGLTNAMQFLPFIKGVGGKELIKTTTKAGKVIKAVTTAAGEFLGEGGEEVAQSKISAWSQDKPFDITSKDTKMEFVLGGLQGLVFTAGGAIVDSKTGEDMTAKVVENGIEGAKQTIKEIEDRVINEVPSINKEVTKQVANGVPFEVAKVNAVEKFAEQESKQIQTIAREVISEKVKEEGEVVKTVDIQKLPVESAGVSEEKEVISPEAQKQVTREKANVGEPIKVGELEYTPDVTLSKEKQAIEAKFAKELGENLAANEEKYTKEFGIVLNADNARELSEDYNKDRATNSAVVHEPASAFIRQLYAKRLAEQAPEGKFNEVLFTAGGTGAGKSTALRSTPEYSQSVEKAQIVYDTNLSSFNSSKQKVDQALAADKKVKIVFVLRDPVQSMIEGAIGRAKRMGRTVPVDVHIDTHVKSLETIKKLKESYKDNKLVSIEVIDNNGGFGKAKVIPIEKITMLSYNKEKAKNEIIKYLEKIHAEGKLSDKLYEGFTGRVSGRVSKEVQEGGKTPSKEPKQANKVVSEVSDTAYKSIVENGGVTINLEGNLPSKGIAYSPFKGVETIIDKDKFSQKDVEDFMDKHADKLNQPGNHIGAWENEGKIYLDISKVGEKNAETFQNAINEEQLAAFDLETFTEISLGKIENGKYTKLYEATNHPYLNKKEEVKPSLPRVEEKPREVQPRKEEGPRKEINLKERQEAVKKPVEEGPGKAKLSRVAERVLAKLQDIKATDVTYNPMSIVEDAAKASEFVVQQPESALRIAKGLELPPADITETAISIAMAEKARQDGDMALYTRLIMSRTFRQTRRGQEIVAERGRMDENSSEFFIKKLLAERARIVASGKKWLFAKEAKVQEVIKKEVTELKKTINKRVLNKLESAQKLIDQLTCKV